MRKGEGGEVFVEEGGLMDGLIDSLMDEFVRASVG